MNRHETPIEDPDESDSERAFAEWAAEISDEMTAGVPIDLDRLASQHPEHFYRLLRLIPALGIMAKVAESTRTEVGIGPVATFDRLPSLGDFDPIRIIGRGGMGLVYEATQRSLNRRVALKILPITSSIDPQRVRRFQIEVETASCLRHPHIVPVYSVGEENGVHYFAMQYIEGCTIGDVIADDRARRASHDAQSPPEAYRFRRAAEFGRQASEALQFAHDQGVFHRDIKPSNLLVNTNDFLWVVDFGLARVIGGANLTGTGEILGTLRYSSPEQAFQNRGIVDQRTDIYSLGATLYELVTLRPAFEADDQIRLIWKLGHDEPSAPREVMPSTPRDLETIILKAMAKDPADRYLTVRELGDDLQRFLERRPILARPRGVIDRAAKWVQRNRKPLAVTVIGAVLLLAGLGAETLRLNGLLSRHNGELVVALNTAERNEHRARRHSYSSQMLLAQQAQASGQVDFTQELLDSLRPEAGENDLRGFEWSFLYRLSHREVSVFFGHDSPVGSLAVTPDGQTLISGDRDGMLLFRSLPEGRFLHGPIALQAMIVALNVSRDGRILTARLRFGDDSEAVQIWDMQRSMPVARVTITRSSEVDLSPDGRYLAVVSLDDARLPPDALFEIDREKSRLTRHPFGRRYRAVAFGPDGWTIALATPQGRIDLRDLPGLAERRSITMNVESAFAIRYSPDRSLIALSTSKGIAFLDESNLKPVGMIATPSMMRIEFSSDNERLVGVPVGHDDLTLVDRFRMGPHRIPLSGFPSGRFTPYGYTHAFSPDGRRLASAGIGLTPTIWDATTGQRLNAFPGMTGNILSLIYPPDGRSLIFGDEHGRVRVWKSSVDPEPVTTLQAHDAEVWALAYTPDGSTLISASDDSTIKLWKTHPTALRSTLKGHESLVTSLSVSPDGRRLASGSFDNTVRVWELPSGRPLFTYRGHTGRVRCVAFSPDGTLIASGGEDRIVRIWDARSGRTTRTFEGPADHVRALAFDPDGSRLVASGNDRIIRVWDLLAGAAVRLIPTTREQVAFAFSPDGRQLAAGDGRGNVTLRESERWEVLRSFKASDACVWSLSYSPDGRTLAAACDDAKVRLWDPQVGLVMLVLSGHARRVNAVAFSSEGTSLASAGHDGMIRVWSAESP